MRTFLRAALAALALALWQAPLAAETVQGTARVGNRTIALPPGTWTRSVEILQPRGFEFGGAPSNAMNISAAFMRVIYGRVTGVALVYMTREPSVDFRGFTSIRNCSRNDFYFIAVRANFPHDQDCTFATHTVPAMPADATTFMARTLTEARGLGLVSPTYFAVVTRRSDQLHSLTVEYWLAPEAFEFRSSNTTWANSPWHVSNLDAPRRAFLERLKAWAELAQEQTRQSFRNRPVTPLPEP
jgi:hypothetical protein